MKSNYEHWIWIKIFFFQITQECITVIEKLSPTLVREYVCYREYLVRGILIRFNIQPCRVSKYFIKQEAEDALTLWKQTKWQRPTADLHEMVDPMLKSLSDRVLHDQRRKEVEIAEENWKKALEFHGKTAIDAFMKILTFPDGGWLRGCCNPVDEDESFQINSVRRIIMKKVL